MFLHFFVGQIRYRNKLFVRQMNNYIDLLSSYLVRNVRNKMDFICKVRDVSLVISSLYCVCVCVCVCSCQQV
jgi:hypothetical protein